MYNKALEILKLHYGYDSFRKGQDDIIKSILNKKESIGLMPTGGGKSICYQIPALIFDGITIVVSPLISLMKDQVDALNSMGIDATYINSSLTLKESNKVLRGIQNYIYKIVYVAPERLESDFFRNATRNLNISMVAIDEAHCLSQWGHDFRKSYLSIPYFIKMLDSRPIVSAFTATATPEVVKDIHKKLELKNPQIFTNGFDRENLSFSLIKGENAKKFIHKYIKSNSDKSGIVYASTRKQVDSLYIELDKKGYKVGKYHAGLTDKEKSSYQEDFIYDRINIMVATNAFGMGIDKSNVRYVIHNNMPKDLESYYQEAGRAGRDGAKSECYLIFNPADVVTQRYFIENNEFECSDEIKDIKYRKLSAIVNYCHSSSCLRASILKYFGETEISETCGNCSNCLDETTKVDITEESKKIISCIGRTKELYGTGMISSILSGSKNRKILDWRLDKVSTYGIMSDYSAKAIKEMINLLLANGYIITTDGKFPILKLTDESYKFLKSDDKIYQKISNIKKVYNINEELLTKLKSLRMKLATKQGVPPYLIFTDKTINDMVETIPTTKDEFLGIKGVGEVKFNKFGEVFLDILKDYKTSNNNNSNTTIITALNSSKGSHLISYELYSKGQTIKEISESRGISTQTVENHLLQNSIEGRSIFFEDFFNRDEESEILDAIKEVGHEKLNPIKKLIDKNIDYNKIKAVITKNFLITK